MRTVSISELPGLMECPNYNGGLKDDPGLTIGSSSEAADIGTAVHNVLEDMVRNDGEIPDDMTPYAIRAGLDVSKVSEIRPLVYTACRIWNEVRSQFPEPILEGRVRGVIGEANAAGRFDVAGFPDFEAVAVLDWKTGMDTSVAVHQLMGYALLACQKYPGITRASIFIAWLREGRWTRFDFTVEELVSFANTFQRRVVESKGDTYRVGSHCTYCTKRFDCEAKRQIVRQTASELEMVGEAGLVPFDTMSPGEMGPAAKAMLDRIKMIERSIEDFRAGLKERVQANGGRLPIDGEREIRLIETRRESIVPEKAFAVLEDIIPYDKIMQCVSISKSEVMDIVGANAAKGCKGKDITAATNRLAVAGALRTSSFVQMRVVNVKTPGAA